MTESQEVQKLRSSRLGFLWQQPRKEKKLDASKELSESREDNSMPDWFWVSSFEQNVSDKNSWLLDNQI